MGKKNIIVESRTSVRCGKEQIPALLYSREEKYAEGTNIPQKKLRGIVNRSNEPCSYHVIGYFPGAVTEVEDTGSVFLAPGERYKFEFREDLHYEIFINFEDAEEEFMICTS